MEKEKKRKENPPQHKRTEKKRYGNRVRSRLRAMFNLVNFNQNAIDKRA